MAENTPSFAEIQPGNNTGEHLSQDIIEKLAPQEFQDTDGNTQTLYTFKSKNGKQVRALFYLPEELPFNADVVANRPAFIYGDKPRWRQEQKWESFIQQTKDASLTPFPHNPSTYDMNAGVSSGNAIFFVEATPQHLLDFAFSLGVEGKALREGRLQAKRRQLTPEVNAMLDRIIAGKLVDDEGNLTTEMNTRGEALAIMELMGDTHAKDLLDMKVKTLVEHDQDKKKEALDYMKERIPVNTEALRLEDLVAVHLARYAPQRGSDGLLHMISTFDATRWRMPRDTIHFALNHPVTDHMYGSWSDAPYAVLAPLKDMIDKNGNPAILNTVDTFFEVTPGTTLTLPEGTLFVKPGESPYGQLMERRGETVTYKAKNVTPLDVQAVCETLSEHERYFLNQSMTSSLAQTFSWYGEFPLPEDVSMNFSRKAMDTTQEDTRTLLDMLKEKPPDEAIAEFLVRLEAADLISDEAKKSIANQTRQTIIAKIKEHAVRETIRGMGFQDKPGGNWAWGGSWKVTEQTAALGVQIGVGIGAHNGHVSNLIEESALKGLEEISEGKRNPKEKLETEFMREDQLLSSSPQARRMLYLVGAI